MTAAPDNRLSVSARARIQPNAQALVTPQQSWTYAQVAVEVQAVKAWLASVDRHPPCVAFHAVSTPNTILLTWTLMELGIPFVPLHPRWSDADCARAISETGAMLLRPPSDFPALPPTHRKVDADPICDPERPLAIVYTSGSSGPPKGALLSRRAFAAAAAASEQNLGLSSLDRWYLSLPLGHVAGLAIVMRCTWAGAALVLRQAHDTSSATPPKADAFRAEEFVAEATALSATLASLVPTQLKRLCDAQCRPPTTLRAVLVGGAALDPGLHARAIALGWPIYRTYGLTETCAQVATELRPGFALGLTALSGMELGLRSGRLAVRGTSLFSGYWGGPPHNVDDWFVTGDLAALQEDGTVQILGRADDVIITGGENVHPTEVEAALARCADVDAACVFGRPSEVWGEEVCAVVVRTADAHLSLEHCRRQLLQYLAAFKVPKAWAVVDSLPLGPTGKISRTEAQRRWASVCGRLESE